MEPYRSDSEKIFLISRNFVKCVSFWTKTASPFYDHLWLNYGIDKVYDKVYDKQYDFH